MDEANAKEEKLSSNGFIKLETKITLTNLTDNELVLRVFYIK